MWLIYFLVFFLFSLDRLTKYYFVFTDKQHVVLDNFLIFELKLNHGIAFSLPMNMYLYYFLFIIIFICLMYFLKKYYEEKNKLLITCIFLIIAGAISNLIDRLRYGGVVDFINVPWWSIFNLADCYIIAAVFFWVAYLFKNGEKISKKN